MVMAKLFDVAPKSTLALRQRKAFLLRPCPLPPDLLRASVVERFTACGKPTCHCRGGGPKHGPFFYLTQCLAVGKMNKFLLKSEPQIIAARQGAAHFHTLQERLEELSQINAELLRRNEPLLPDEPA